MPAARVQGPVPPARGAPRHASRGCGDGHGPSIAGPTAGAEPSRSSGPRYMRYDAGGGDGEGEGEATTHTLWWPPGKINGRYPTPWLPALEEEAVAEPLPQSGGWPSRPTCTARSSPPSSVPATSAATLLDLLSQRIPPRPCLVGDLVPLAPDLIRGGPLAPADAVQLIADLGAGRRRSDDDDHHAEERRDHGEDRADHAVAGGVRAEEVWDVDHRAHRVHRQHRGPENRERGQRFA